MSLARILNKPRGRQSFISDSRWVLPTCLIGMEHEYESVRDPVLPKHTFADFWQYHEEGSLRDHGAEFVFATPMFGVDTHNALEWLVSHAKSSDWQCTKRTGIHVHLDVRDLAVPQLAGLCLIYAAVEKILYRWVGDSREVSHFCLPLYQADEALLAVASIIKFAFLDDRSDGHEALRAAEEYQRYAGFNLQALFKFGSIEFRQLQTTHDLQKIEDWINILMSLKATAFKLPQSDGAVVRMIQRMGAYELLNYVFPKYLADKLYTEKSQEDFIAVGLPSARDIAVHGCTVDNWVKRNFPKGEHKGFSTWIKSSTKEKERNNEMDILYEAPAPDPDEEGEDLIDPVPAPRNHVPRADGRDMPIGLQWGDNPGVFARVNAPGVAEPLPRMLAENELQFLRERANARIVVNRVAVNHPPRRPRR